MKNKYLVGLITVFVSIIVCITVLNLVNSSSKKNYYFDRTFVENNFFKFSKTISKLNYKSDFLFNINSDNLLVEKEFLNNANSTNFYKLYLSDLNFEKKNRKDIDLPMSADIKLCIKNVVFYVQKFKLYNYNLISKNREEIKLKNFKIVSLFPLKGSETKFISFGELLKDGVYYAGFFIIDTKSSTVNSLKILEETKESKVISSSLQYSGSFSSNTDNGFLVYCCNKYSKIYFFSAQTGVYKKVLTTKEDVPLPQILQNNKGDSFYARGTTRNTNMGMFLKDGNVFVFSARSPLDNRILVDIYSSDSFKYEKSIKFFYKNFDSKSIEMIVLNGNKIIIGFSTDYAVFNFL
ncbi:hypothetical protein [Flavobacterium sp. HBTb2-11-1]|uniref:hypothetical protein n=1 Tax=Flavobacterium sp. HBTb2-11-1 TaxID=2692212 RepID=UPI00136C8D74|nr:hypothetical protein [Flavobacterium sp. HBTb2-11-1]MXO06455.1 hypothetical protein [Flavobacterium sp. HBTb2-11-1]